jgi:hypothetical protein
MQRQTKYIIGSAAVVAIGLGAIGGAVAASTLSDDDGADTPITGDALDTATAVALDHLGQGRVTGTEIGDEDSYYEVEVTLDDGNAVDVQLDEDFNVVSSSGDVEGDEGSD